MEWEFGVGGAITEKKILKKNVCVCVCISESFCSTAVTDTTL